MLTLAMDTATAATTVAVADGPTVLAERNIEGARQHGEALAPAIADVLAAGGLRPGDLDAVGVGVGPGPFTGLRVGLMTARTVGAALGISVRGVCSLDLVASDALRTVVDEEFLVVIDARRREVYWAAYGVSAIRRDGPHVSAPRDIVWSGPVVGEGAALYPDRFPDRREPLRPSAAALCRWLAEGKPTLEPLPLYLRRPDAVEPGRPKPVGGRV